MYYKNIFKTVQCTCPPVLDEWAKMIHVMKTPASKILDDLTQTRQSELNSAALERKSAVKGTVDGEERILWNFTIRLSYLDGKCLTYRKGS